MDCDRSGHDATAPHSVRGGRPAPDCDRSGHDASTPHSVRGGRPAPDQGGISRVVLPIGVNAVESVNCYVLPDGDRVTVVDCGVWRPDLPDGGLAALEAGLEGAGYALADVGRVVVTHAHIDHYGLAGRLMELTGAELGCTR